MGQIRNPHHKCPKCGEKKSEKYVVINSVSQLCRKCLIRGSNVVNSGNAYIDNFIKQTQSPERDYWEPFLEWAPFEEFTDVEKIGQGGYSEIYKACWKNNEDRSKKQIVLKVLNDSHKDETEFLNEVIIVCVLVLISTTLTLTL